MSPTKINIKSLNHQTLNAYKSCFKNNGKSKKTANIKWQFFKNKPLESLVNIAFDEEKNKTAAIYALFLVKFKIGEAVFTGSQSLDTITDIDYRGQGLFIKLAKDIYLKAKKSGIALVYGFPNKN